jgi:hypothetical protein
MNRRLPLILVAGVLVLCVIGVILAGISAGSGFGAVAYTVGDTKVSQQSVNDDLKALAENKSFSESQLAQPFQTTPGAVASTASATWLTLEIRRVVFADALAKQGGSVSAKARTAALAEIVGQVGPSFRTQLRTLPRGMQHRLLDFLVLQGKVKAAAFKGVHITVDPKYGFWSPRRLAVCPPTGCPKASASAAAGG